jgi:hypothetical protein
MKARGASAWEPAERTRKVSKALQAYAAWTTSASCGAVRDVSRIQKYFEFLVALLSIKNILFPRWEL